MPTGIQTVPTVTTQNVTEPTTSGSGTSAKDVQHFLISLGIVIAVLYAMVIVAGTSRAAGKVVVALLIALVVLQGIGHTSGLTSWINKHPLTP